VLFIALAVVAAFLLGLRAGIALGYRGERRARALASSSKLGKSDRAP
jgi:hypothetical protein